MNPVGLAPEVTGVHSQAAALRAPLGADSDYSSASVLLGVSQVHLLCLEQNLVLLKQYELYSWEAFFLF